MLIKASTVKELNFESIAKHFHDAIQELRKTHKDVYLTMYFSFGEEHTEKLNLLFDDECVFEFNRRLTEQVTIPAMNLLMDSLLIHSGIPRKRD